MMTVSIFCLGKKGLDVLQRLPVEQHQYVECVVVGRDPNIQNDYAKEIITYTKIHGISCFERSHMNLASLSSDYIFAIGWRWIIKEVKNSQRIIVFHDSLLPKYRGFNPLVTALINGDTQIGVTALLATNEYDRGDIIAQRSVEIKYPIKINTAIEILGIEYSILFNELMDTLIAGKPLNSSPQVESLASYSLWRDENDYCINWNRSASEICRMVNAVGFPYKGSFTFFEGKKVRVLEVEQVPDVNIANRDPGKLIYFLEGCPVIVCGSGLLKLLRCTDASGNDYTFEGKFRIRLSNN
ncbi:MAG: hypothetical protein KF856_13785 [Cyclobacteriaceae bacterium]|nr:hypothetical protein [Cyclobacteriaceae bacterium]